MQDVQVFHLQNHLNHPHYTTHEPILKIQILPFLELFGLKQVVGLLELLSDVEVKILKDLKVFTLLFQQPINELLQRLVSLSIHLLYVILFFNSFQYHFQNLKVA